MNTFKKSDKSSTLLPPTPVNDQAFAGVVPIADDPPFKEAVAVRVKELPGDAGLRALAKMIWALYIADPSTPS
jgi:hypothetical protein